MGRKIKQESLTTFVYSSLNFYQSMSLAFLTDSFELEQKVVVKLLSTMMQNQTIGAKFEDGFLVVVSNEKPKLQTMMLNYADKLYVLSDNNEKMMEVKVGNYERQKPKKMVK